MWGRSKKCATAKLFENICFEGSETYWKNAMDDLYFTASWLNGKNN